VMKASKAAKECRSSSLGTTGILKNPVIAPNDVSVGPSSLKRVPIRVPTETLLESPAKKQRRFKIPTAEEKRIILSNENEKREQRVDLQWLAVCRFYQYSTPTVLLLFLSNDGFVGSPI